MRKRPPPCEGCFCNPAEDNFQGKHRIGEFVPPNSCGQKIMAPGDGDFDIDLYIIAMAPSFHEEEEGTPLVGPSGVMANQQIARYEHELGRKIRVRKINLVNCRTQRLGMSGFVNRNPTMKEIKTCGRRWLLPELRALAAFNKEEPRYTQSTPQLVLWAMGEQPHKVIFRKFGKFKDARGSRLPTSPLEELADTFERLCNRGMKKKKTTIRRCKGCMKFIRKPRLKCDGCRKTKRKKS